MNNYKSDFASLQASHNDIPVFGTGAQRTLPEGNIAQSYARSTHLIDNEGQPTVPVRVESHPSRRRLLAAGVAALALATTGTVLGVKAVEPSTHTGPNVASEVHGVYENENNHEPIQMPNPVTPADGGQSSVPTDNP